MEITYWNSSFRRCSPLIPPPIYSWLRPAGSNCGIPLKSELHFRGFGLIRAWKNLAEIICRFADALALLTYICVMIQDLWWSRTFSRLLDLWCYELLPPIAEARAFLALRFPCLLYLGCRSHPFSGVNTTPAWHVCVCVCRRSYKSAFISPLRLTENNIQHHCNTKFLLHDMSLTCCHSFHHKQGCDHSAEPAGSQMKKSVHVWAPDHFDWIVAACFLFLLHGPQCWFKRECKGGFNLLQHLQCFEVLFIVRYCKV